MSLTSVTHTVLTPGRGSFDPGAVVTVALCVPALAGDGVALVGVTQRRVGPAGTCTLTLDPNSELNPAGTWYLVTDPDGTTWSIVVPPSAVPVPLAQCVSGVGSPPGLVGVTPAQLAAAIAAQAASDAGVYPSRSGRSVVAPQFPLPRTIAASAPTVSLAGAPAAGLATSPTFGQVPCGRSPSPLYTICGTANLLNNGGANGVSGGHAYPKSVVADNSTVGRLATTLMFGCSGNVIDIKITSAPGHQYRVRIDGNFLTSTDPVAGPGDGGTYYLHIDLTALASKRRVIRVDMVNGDFWGIYKAATDSCWAVTPRGPRCIVLGDSYAGGAGAAGVTGFSAISSWVSSIADHLGWEDVWNSGIGGTGFITRNSGVNNNFLDRLASDVLAFAPDVVMVQGGHNDIGSGAAAIQAAATSVYQQLRAGLPNAKIFSLGPLFAGAAVDTSTTTDATWTPVQNAISAGAAAAPGVIDLRTDMARIFTGTGTVAATTGAGNGDIYIQSDGTHPVQAGADYLGHRMAQLVTAALTRY